MISCQPMSTLREIAPAGLPQISVVIPSTSGPDSLKDCLRALQTQTLNEQAEVIVIDCGGAGVADLVRCQFPRVKLLSLPNRKTIPELRAIGMKESRGAIISIIEDHCIPDSHWYEHILRAHDTWYGAVGGAVENDPHIARLIDWAVFFCEYGRYMKPVPYGEVRDIAGINASYRREFLSSIADLLEEGRSWDPVLNARLREKGIKLYSDPAIVVYHKKEFGLGYFLTQRFHYSRSFAGARIGKQPFWKRLMYAAFCFLLPPLLMARIAAWVLGKRRHVTKFVFATPLLALFVLVWAGGEWVGYLFGPGDSLSKVD